MNFHTLTQWDTLLSPPCWFLQASLPSQRISSHLPDISLLVFIWRWHFWTHIGAWLARSNELLSEWGLPWISQPLFFLIYFTLFYSRTVDLQCCINFCCTSKWLSYVCAHIHTHIYIFFFIFFSIIWKGYLIFFLMLYSRTLLFIHSICDSLHLLTLLQHSYQMK